LAFCPNCGKEVLPGDSFCRNCGRQLRQPETPSEPKEKTSAWWWLLPFFLGIIGGVVGYVVLESRNRRRATRILIFGVVWTVVGTLLFGILIAGLAFGLYGSLSTSAPVSITFADCNAATKTCMLNVTNDGTTAITPASCVINSVQVSQFSPVPIPAGGRAQETCVAAGGPYSVGDPVSGGLNLPVGLPAPFNTTWS